MSYYYSHECSASYAQIQHRVKMLEHFRRHHAAEEDAITIRFVTMCAAIVVGLVAVAVLFVGLTAGLAAAHDSVPPLDDNGREGLRFCESTNNYGLVHLDVNGQFSRGAYQFQQPTWAAAMTEMSESVYAGRSDWVVYAETPVELVDPWVQDHAATFWWGSGRHRAWPVCHGVAADRMGFGVGGSGVAPLVAPVPKFAG